MNKFISIGGYFINLDQVITAQFTEAHEIAGKRHEVRMEVITTELTSEGPSVASSQSYAFHGEEAEALNIWFSAYSTDVMVWKKSRDDEARVRERALAEAADYERARHAETGDLPF